MFQLIVRGGLVVDGTGKAGYLADIGIEDGKIAVIDRSMTLNAETEREIDANGLVVCPGFIDIHSHSDRSVVRDPGSGSSLVQGITTEVTGMCGGSMAPLSDKAAESYEKAAKQYSQEEFGIPWRGVGEYLDYVDKMEPGTNQCLMIGQGTIRSNILGRETRYPTEEEMFLMRDMVSQGMEEGAFGITTGRAYVPGCYSSIKEIVALCEVVAQYDGLHSSHIMDQWTNVDWATLEIVDVSARSGVRGQIAHQKVVGKDNWGRADEIVSIVEDARYAGIDIMADVYPYTYSQVMLLKNELPRDVRKLEDPELLEVLKEPDFVEKLRDHFKKSAGYTSSRLYQYGIVHCEKTKEYEWMDIGEAANAMGLDIPAAVVKLLIDNDLKVKIAGIMSENDLRTILACPFVMIGTDAVSGNPEKDAEDAKKYSSLHPRHYGTYPRVLGKYAREEKLIPLEQAIMKMTYMPARRCNILDRGRILRGYWADIVIFNPEEICDTATVENPASLPVGINYVIVNGKIAVENGTLTGVRGGRALRDSHHRMVY
ncbi:MAG TPA: D-aminoacylase [Bacillota bacterium]|nr:D-aminoacylase [Bacillota bacterium]HPZ77384.1 D-aminoacylase [Bacillota bacterium]HQD73789.1 D-aminoacylase [Bacillota bacterium]